jgi:hypothetical protein
MRRLVVASRAGPIREFVDALRRGGRLAAVSECRLAPVCSVEDIAFTPGGHSAGGRMRVGTRLDKRGPHLESW